MKKSGKILGLFLLSLVLVSILASFVGAEDLTSKAQDAGQSLATGVKGLASGLISPFLPGLSNFTDSQIFQGLLLFVLLFIIIYDITSFFFSEGKVTRWLVPLIISALSILALPKDFLIAIGDSYGAMGAAILTVIPFIALLLFTARIKSRLVAKMSWVFFAIYYFVLLLADLLNTATPSNTPAYFAAFLVGVVAFFAIGPIRDFLLAQEKKDIEEKGDELANEAEAIYKQRKKEIKAMKNAS